LASSYELKRYTTAISRAPWLIPIARIGYVARGAVYAIIGAFAILAALGAGARTVGSKGALIAILSEPAGRLLLGLVAAGLACFGIWRGLQAFVDADHRGRGMKAGVQRAVYVGAALVNFGLAFWAANTALSWSPMPRSDDKTVHDWTAWLMHFHSAAGWWCSWASGS
jgi:Domain of Unknown Function (DUF1206)